MFWLSLASPLWIDLHRGVCVHDSNAHLVHLRADVDIVTNHEADFDFILQGHLGSLGSVKARPAGQLLYVASNRG